MTIDPPGRWFGAVIWTMSPGLPAGKGLGGTYRSASDTILNFVRFAGALVEEGADVVVVGASVVGGGVSGVVVDATVTTGAVVIGGIAEVSDAPFVVLAHAETTNMRATKTRRRMIEPYSFRHSCGRGGAGVSGISW
jgi:hypothetical protein